MQLMALKVCRKLLNKTLDHFDLDPDLEKNKWATKTIKSKKCLLQEEQQS